MPNQEHLREAYRATFGPPIARLILDDLRQGFHVDRPMYQTGVAHGEGAALDLVFREGQRSVILWLLDQIETALNQPDEVPASYLEQPQEDHYA